MTRCLLAALVPGVLLAVSVGSSGCQSPEHEPTTAPTAATTAASNTSEFMLGGIQINEPDVEVWLDGLERAGLNTVSMTVYARHGKWNSAELEWDRDPSWLIPEIRAAKARGMYVVLIPRVALEHALTENQFLWHGMIMPETDRELGEWFESYGQFVGLWAEVAEREGVDLFGVGSELNALASSVQVDELPALEQYYLDSEKQARERARAEAAASELGADSLAGRLKSGWGSTYDDLGEFLDGQGEAQFRWAEEVTYGGDLGRYNQRRLLLDRSWRELIAELREVYSGDLTYAANFDQYFAVSFWGELDVMGVNAYFPLRRSLSVRDSDALYEVFVGAWRNVFDELERFRTGLGAAEMPVVFTELGYTRRRGMSIAPWAGAGFNLANLDEGSDGWEKPAEMVVWHNEPEDGAERVLAVRALSHAVRDRPGLLTGLLWWKLSTLPEQQAIEEFSLILGTKDPLEAELRSFRSPVPQAP